MEARDAGLGLERAFREERDGLALLERAQDPARVAAALVAVVPLDEMVAEPAQQGADERQARGLFLDDEAEARRQEREQQRAVDVARVVRDDDAGRLRQPFEAEPADGQAAEAEVRAACGARGGPARFEPRQGEDRQGGEQRRQSAAGP